MVLASRRPVSYRGLAEVVGVGEDMMAFPTAAQLQQVQVGLDPQDAGLVQWYLPGLLPARTVQVIFAVLERRPPDGAAVCSRSRTVRAAAAPASLVVHTNPIVMSYADASQQGLLRCAMSAAGTDMI